MRNVYALLVGINEYDKRLQLPQLKGCISDIQRMRAYLECRLDSDVKLHLRTLTNEQATREKVISGFRQHLAQAQQGDTALFYFAGYGAQAIASNLRSQADHSATHPATASSTVTDTLICYDSRIDDEHLEIASFELEHLLAGISQQHPHVVAIIDTRRTLADWRQKVFSDGAFRRAPDLMPSSKSQSSKSQSSKGQAGRYLLLRDRAASGIENISDGKYGGMLSRFLQTSLFAATAGLTYADLLKRMSLVMRSALPACSPYIKATHSEDLNQPFLGEGSLSSLPPYFTVRHNPVQGWMLNGGLVHGLRASAGSEATILALFPQQATPEQMRQMRAVRATARVSKVLPRVSTLESLELKGAKTSDTFKAVVVSHPLPPLQVRIEGDTGEVNALRRAISVAGPNRQPSSYIQPSHAQPSAGGSSLTENRAEASSLRVLAQNGAYRLMDAAGDRLLIEPILGYDAASAARMVTAMEHIARWQAIAELESPAHSSIQGSVELKLFTGDEVNKALATEIWPTESQSPEIAETPRLVYSSDLEQGASSYSPPRFRLKLHNTSNQALYCALFYLTERFKAAAVRPDKVNSIVKLAPNEEIWFAEGLPLYGTVPDDLWQQGVTECRDAMKLIASTHPFDPTLMNLGALGVPISAATGGETTDSSLEKLMQRIVHRELPAPTGLRDDDLSYDDWTTSQIAFTFVRPQLPVTLPAGGDISISIGSKAASSVNVTLQAPLQFSAVAQLLSATDAAHTFGIDAVTSPLQASFFLFSPSRNSAPGLSVLTLTALSNADSISSEHPLILETEIPLEENEYLLPVAYDGESYVPLGYGKTMQHKTRVVLERLPAALQAKKAEAPQDAICIVFQRMKCTPLPDQLSETSAVSYPLLSSAQVDDSGQVSYAHSVDAIAFKVKQAKAVALYLPGPFHDSESDLVHLKQVFAAAGQPYDLLLTFDYDAAHTSIAQNAQLLKARLADVGLSANHQKKLHLIAHSAGGLIARWLIEQLSGDDAVDHLFLLGTPNGGMGKAQMQAGATSAIALALNGLANMPALRETASNLVRFIDPDALLANVMAEQMQPQSACIQTLLASAQPHVPYTLISGHMDAECASDRRLARHWHPVLEKLCCAENLRDRSSDLLVSSDLMNTLPESLLASLEQQTVACHHFEYLTHPQSKAALSRAIAIAIAKPSQRKSSVSTAPPIAPQPAQSQPAQSQPAQSQPAQSQPAQSHPSRPQPASLQPPDVPATTALAATSAGIAAASAVVAGNAQSLSKTPTNQGAHPMQEPPHPQDSQSSNSSSQNPPSQNPPPASEPPPIMPQPAQPRPPVDSASVVSHDSSEVYSPDDVYAPTYEPSPEAESSPLMWVWLLFTVCLAGLVAWAWIAHLNAPATPSDRETIESVPDSSAPDSAAPELPTVPDDAPTAPGSEP